MSFLNGGSEIAICNVLKIQDIAKESQAGSAEKRADSQRHRVSMFGKFQLSRWLRAAAVAALVFGGSAFSRAGIVPDGHDYALAVPLPGDQARPQMAIGPNGGYLVWEDNVGDGDGLSVNMRRITPTLNGELNVIPLATKTEGNQELPKVTLLAGGGAAFVWQGGPDSDQRVYLRVMTASGVFVSDEIPVSARTTAHQWQASVAGLTNGNIIVVWTMQNVDGSMNGVFGALFGPSGERIGTEFQINQYSTSNQRNGVVAALNNGGFVVGWITEGQRSDSSVDLYARVYGANGTPAASEFRVSNADRVTSSPSLAVTGTGNFTFAWCEVAQDPNIEGVITPGRDTSRWDIYACTFTQAGSRVSWPNKVSQGAPGNQKNPSVAAVGTTQMVVWSSFGQDGDRDSVVGRALSGIGMPEGAELVINTNTAGRQIHPVVAGNNESRFVVSWTQFAGLTSQMELMASRFEAEASTVTLSPPAAPTVSALSPNRLSVTWAAVEGYGVQNYELYLDGNPTPIVVNGQIVTIDKLNPGTSHTIEIAYKLNDGQLSPRSAAVTGKTFEEDDNFDGIPDDWQALYWGNNPNNWPATNVDSDGDGLTNRQEYMVGTNPKDASSVLRTSFVATPQGLRLAWTTTQGFLYQVQQTSNFGGWTDLGGPRYAAGTTDSISVPAGNSLGYYRVIRIR